MLAASPMQSFAPVLDAVKPRETVQSSTSNDEFPRPGRRRNTVRIAAIDARQAGVGSRIVLADHLPYNQPLVSIVIPFPQATS